MAGINTYYNEVLPSQQAAVQRNIAHNAQLNAQRTAQVNASIEQTRQQIHERSQSHYTPQDAFGDALMGRTAFHDPNSTEGNYHYEQGNPLYTYVNERGEFYSTNDAMDDPNIGSSWNWVPAQQV